MIDENFIWKKLKRLISFEVLPFRWGKDYLTHLHWIYQSNKQAKPANKNFRLPIFQ